MLSIFSSHAMLLPIEIMLQIILNNVLNNSYCITFIFEEKLNFQTTKSFKTVLINGTDNKLFAEQTLEASEMGCSDFVVMMREPALFIKALDETAHVGKIRRGDKRIVIIPRDDHSDWLNILSMKETSYIPNLLLIVPANKSISGCAGFDLVTHKYVGPDEASHNQMHLDSWNSCTMKFEKNANLFPHDLSNLFGKTIKIATLTYSPYTLLDLDTTIAPLGRDGTEIRMVDEFCRWVNCTVVLVRNEGDLWGEIYDNMTGFGLLGDIIQDDADIGMPVFSWYGMYRWLDFSAYVIRSGVTCIAPAPRLLVNWDMPLLPFSWIMWIGMVLTFFLSTLAVICAQRSSEKAFLTTFGILTGQAREEIRPSWRIRRVTGWLILTGLVLINAYSAGLSSTFTVPKFEDSIDTIQDLVNRKMEWAATDASWVFSISMSQETLIQQLIRQFIVLNNEELKKPISSRNMAFVVEKLPSGCFAIGEYVTREVVPEYRLMKEEFYHDYTVMMLRKSSPYTQKISSLILRLHEAGLMLAFETQVAQKHLDYKVQVAVKYSRSTKTSEIQPLSFRHVVGIFHIYMVGAGLSLLMFIIEVIYRRKSREVSSIK